LIFVHAPYRYRACYAIFSLAEPSILYAVSEEETLRINMADGSSTQLSGHPDGLCASYGDAMALSDDGRVLYVGYYGAQCVLAYSVTMMKGTWKTKMANGVNSVSYHAGLVLVGVQASEFCVLNADKGDVLRKFAKTSSFVFGHMVISGVCVCVCAFNISV
jgi:hypothetical protein